MRIVRGLAGRGLHVRASRRGSAMILAVVVIMMLTMLAFTVAAIGTRRSESALEDRFRVELLLAADSGVAMKTKEIRDSEGADLADRVYGFPGGTIAVAVHDLGTDGVDNDGDGNVDEADEQGVVRLVSTATSARNVSHGRPLVRTVEVYEHSVFHPLFYKALYVGNKYGVTGYGLTLGPGDAGLRNPSTGDNAAEAAYQSPSRGASSQSGGTTPTGGSPAGLESYHTNAADYVYGDAYVNGDLELRGNTNAYGDVDVVGSAKGRPVSGETNEGASVIEPPDLAAQDYEGLSQWTVDVDDPTPYVNSGRSDTNTTNYATGVTNDADGDGLGLPSFINYGPFTSDEDHFHQQHSGDFDLHNFHFGASGATVDFGSVTGPDGSYGTADDRRLFFVKGNMWMDTRGTTHFDFPSDKKVQITVVVEGNLFISDELSYGTDGDDAILFIAKAKDDDPATTNREDESFVDGSLDGTPNGRYDEGETIINDEPAFNDDGSANPYHGHYNGTGADGVYGTADDAAEDAIKSPKEGQGNVYYGELVATEGGISDGYFYAQNNAYIMPLPAGADDKKKIYGVRGFLSAGGVFVTGDRSKGDDYVNYRAEYDDRLETGEVDLPGVPTQGGSYAGLQVFTWRELPPGSR